MHTVEPPPLSYRLNEIALAVANTRERFMHRRKFELAASRHVYEVKLDTPLSEVCGFDPASFQIRTRSTRMKKSIKRLW